MNRASTLLITALFFCASSLAQNNLPYPLQKLTSEAYSYYLNHPDTAIILTQRALDLALAAKDTFHEGYCYFLFSKTYWVKANYKLSTEYGFKALKIFQNTPHHQENSASLLSVARTLVELGNFHKAHEFIHEALELGIENLNENIEAGAYREHSYLLTELNQLDSALYYSDKGIELSEKLGDSLDMGVLYGRKSRIFFLQKQFQKSRHFAYQGMIIDSLVGNRRGLGISYYQVAQNEDALGNRQKAIIYLKRSIRINSEIGNLNWQIEAHELLSTFYLDDKNYALAAAELRKVSQFKDELYNSEKNGQIQEMQSLHELEGKENTIQLLEQEYALKQQQVKNQRLFVAFLLVTVLFLVLLIFVLTRLRAIQNKTNRNLTNQNLAIEQQKIAIQVQAENLRELDQVKTKLFSVISHDLRGPISNLQSLLDLFTKKLMTADEFVTLSGKLKENLNLTQRTLENLLNWSLSQMGGIKTEKKKIEITDCIEEACQLMEEVAARKNLTLRKQFDGPMKVWADADQLQVILRNLIHNAIKFSAINERIDVKAFRDNDHCQITIKDSGIGMTRDEINTLIGSKEYFSKTGTEQEKGTGLGLPLCKEFITRNGGDISIKSSLGEGTEVSFTLLLAEHQTSLELAVPR
ncbi:MAG: ATP-binding protein [Cyclobacteriaceae bacterium]